MIQLNEIFLLFLDLRPICRTRMAYEPFRNVSI